MNRRRIVTACFALPALAAAQALAQRAAAPRVGLLWIDDAITRRRMEAFRAGLRALGYVEGKNIQIDERYLVKRYADIQQSAVRLAADKVDAIVCFGATATKAAAGATSAIPVLTLMGADPVKLGVAVSLAKPGKNVTGMVVLGEELTAKRLEVLKETIPSIRRVGFLMNPESAGVGSVWANHESAAATLKLELRQLTVQAPDEIDPVIDNATRAGIQGISVAGSSMLFSHRERVLKAIARAKLPAIYSWPEYVEEGGLMAYSGNAIEDFHRLAVFVDKVIKGTPPGDIPIEQSMRISLTLNLKTAKAMGIKLPQTVLVRATRVIE